MQYAYSFNNNFCILLLGIRFKKGYWILDKIFDGSFTDFSQGWYEIIGQQYVVNYIVNIVVWIVMYLLSQLI